MPKPRAASSAVARETAAIRRAIIRLRPMKRLNDTIVFIRCRPGMVIEVRSCSVTTAGVRSDIGSVPCGPQTTSPSIVGRMSCCQRIPFVASSTRKRQRSSPSRSPIGACDAITTSPASRRAISAVWTPMPVRCPTSGRPSITIFTGEV